MLKRKFTTLDKYGTHIIEVSEIYNGNISGSSKVKVATLFEDKAGDEDGATEGKIHIGDYVNYNPIAVGDTGTESKYKYPSPNNSTGIEEAIAANKVTGFTDESQDFTTKSDIKWQVIGIEEESILITTETPIIPDNPISIQVPTGTSSYTTLTGYGLYGAKAYLNYIDEINNISKIYGKGKGSDSSKTRGMTIEDVNKITGVTADGTTITPSGVDVFGTYGISYNIDAGSSKGWSPESWILKTENSTSPGITEKSTEYGYEVANASLKTSKSDSIRYGLICGKNNSRNCFLGSCSIGGISTYTGVIGFGWASINGAGFISGNNNAFFSNGDNNVVADGICPVVYLNANVSLTSAGTSNKVTTWNID